MKAKIIQLEKQIEAAETIIQKIDYLNELGRLLRYIDELKSINISNRAYFLSTTCEFKKQPYQTGLAYSLTNLCELNFMQGKTQSSLSQGNEALKIFEQLDDFDGQALALSILGFSQYALGDYPRAFEYENKSIQFAKKTGNRDIEGQSLGILAAIYSRLGKHDEMQKTYKQALESFTETKNFIHIAATKNNMALNYMAMGDFNLALHYGLESLDLCKTYGLFASQNYTLETLGGIYLKMENYELAKNYLEEALFDKNIKINEYGKSILLIQLGRLHIKLQTGSAEKFLQQALILSEQFETKNEQVKIHKLLSELYEKLGEITKALSHFKQFHELDKDIKCKVNETSQLYEELQKAHEEIKILQGIIPICCHCKKIRDDSGYWNQIEIYIQKHSEAEFSHGMCPECLEEVYSKEKWYIDSLKNTGK